MALQDLTPQLRTRLNRVERAVGWFVLLATLLLVAGFVYYTYSTAELKGWFKTRARYYTYADSGAGLSVGDPVSLMGFPAGLITKIVPMPPRGQGSEHNVFIEFSIVEPNFGYLWTQGSEARLTAAGFLGKRQLDVTRGTNGYATYLQRPIREIALSDVPSLPHFEKWRLGQEIYDGTNFDSKAWQPLTNSVLEKLAALKQTSIMVIDTTVTRKDITAVWNPGTHRYEAYGRNSIYELPTYEEPALNDRLQKMVSQVEEALPHFLSLTNQISNVLSNSAQLTGNLNAIAESARPMITNLSVISDQLRDPKGSLGEWLIPTNINSQLETTLQNASLTMTNANTNIVLLVGELSRSLENLAGITSNLNSQVQVNSNMLAEISDVIVHSDQLVQGLKHHWLLRSAFRTPKTNAPPARKIEPVRSPKAAGQP